MTKEEVFEYAKTHKQPNKWAKYEYLKKKLLSMPPEEYEEAIKKLSDILEV
jgi:hypothetical protein